MSVIEECPHFRVWIRGVPRSLACHTLQFKLRDSGVAYTKQIQCVPGREEASLVLSGLCLQEVKAVSVDQALAVWWR